MGTASSEAKTGPSAYARVGNGGAVGKLYCGGRLAGGRVFESSFALACRSGDSGETGGYFAASISSGVFDAPQPAAPNPARRRHETSVDNLVMG
jgi:hypothetical protein